jgi:hypothetical protein
MRSLMIGLTLTLAGVAVQAQDPSMQAIQQMQLATQAAQQASHSHCRICRPRNEQLLRRTVIQARIARTLLNSR